MSGYCEKNNVFGDLQGAFRKNRRLENHIFALKGLCSLRKANKKNTWLSFIDITKAFDVINRDQLFVKLWNTGIQGKLWRIFRETYRGVQNKVFFGNYSTPWYEVSTGLKQGCCLSPTTFSIVMTDLISALNKEELGISFESKKIPALLFADDIVLMAESEDQLQRMLNIVNSFGNKWGFKFDPTKSKVMVIGKRIDKHKIWYIGSLEIKEVNEYKYLGVYISRSLKDRYHISKCLKEKSAKIRNLIASTLSKHCNVKRVEFGNTLYNAKFVPGILNASGALIFSEESKKAVSTMQYKMAQDILQLKCKPATEALLGDLGWAPICNIIDRRQIDYFIYLKFSLPDGLHREVFDQLYSTFIRNKEGPWHYFSNVKNVLSSYGLDDVMHRSDVDWYKSYLLIANEMYTTNFYENIKEKTSLQTYKWLKHGTKMELYMRSDTDFYGQKVKFRARTGCLGLNTDLERWNKSDGICHVCNNNVRDTIEHRLLFCPSERQNRINLHRDIAQLGGPYVLSQYIQLRTRDKLNWILGDGAYDTWGHELGVLFDKCSKHFLVSIYNSIKENSDTVLF